MNGIRGTASVVGVGLSTRWEAPGRTALELMAEAVHVAISVAGLRLDQVDGLLTGDIPVPFVQRSAARVTIIALAEMTAARQQTTKI